jgi:hypothetical protein
MNSPTPVSAKLFVSADGATLDRPGACLHFYFFFSCSICCEDWFWYYLSFTHLVGGGGGLAAHWKTQTYFHASNGIQTPRNFFSFVVVTNDGFVNCVLKKFQVRNFIFFSLHRNNTFVPCSSGIILQQIVSAKSSLSWISSLCLCMCVFIWI